MNDLEEIIYKHALLNAAKHKGSANPGAVMGSIMANEPELRSKAKEIGPMSGKIVAKVNALSPEEQASEMEKLGVPNAEYVKRHNGKLILRIEDTDPKRVYEPAYEMIPEDLEWLGINPDEVIYQSDRFETYYDYARQLIEKGAAYMCTCDGADFKELKDNCKACPCRDNSVEENLALWEKFDTMDAGEAVLRVKTDIAHKNPAIRDWVAMRLVDETHPRLGNKYRCSG